ncbi:Drebrin-like protein [Fulvia fulva]|uniref:Drebrin-like protein n=1 Tax=Passalora fulva TaxID=5499 RepID=A0A9Q8L7J7_PASFU|nr:Drebrin-like protein [Fulvia fulva]KAK4635275.1 Drebrin-like protein [Fulvia fulva]KAK4638081.1 Drebrin-like protein [Fulvia fulva]UJO12189.1 Drebrin-like protein [Fulvia fulva]WPV09084.1 Drebrin-like protein [Fulvia fulva]WPV23081.1 Drebrin-like protein [Fulvia fulva]
MATLNLSQNGPSITNSYQKIVNSSPSGPAAASPTYGIWAVFSVKAPLANAFQAESGKESILNVQTTGEGELADLLEDFSDGRIQFAFVKVKDPNTTLPKSVLIAWCGEGVPERTKGYFTSHLSAVSKVLHGYHVQVTARSDRDLTPEVIVQKVADSSGSKYSGGGSVPAPASSRPPPPKAKPVLPTKSFGAAGGFQPLGGVRTRAPAPSGPTDDDGWGQDAPQVSRSQLEKVESAYKPTKVDINALQSQREPSKYQAPSRPSNGSADVVSGGYQPIGKVDIAALRRQAQEGASTQDDRPTVVKGAYEPVGKVDINEIRRKAQGAPAAAQPPPPQPSADEEDRPRSLADRSAAFTQAKPLTELPKPKVANRFGAAAGTFGGTKAPTPGGFEAKPLAAAAPVGTASKTFADEGGKTPAQLWAEKKARERGDSGAAQTQIPSHSGTPASPIRSQESSQWQSGYEGKKWGVQIPTRTGGSGISEQRTGHDQSQEENEPPTGGVGSIRDRFAGAAPMGASREATGAPEPPPLDTSSKPNAGVRGVPIPGLPQRPAEEDVPAEQHQDLPPPPPRPQPDEDEEENDYEPQGSPVRIAMPVSRGPEPIEPADDLPSRPVPTASIENAIASHREPSPEPQAQDDDPSRGAAQAAAHTTFGEVQDPRGAGDSGGKEAVAQFDYEKDEENEIALREGERITNIDMVDEDWWMGENSRGERGLFPSNYVELVESGAGAAAVPPPAPRATEAEPPAAPQQPAGAQGRTATAEYDYDAAEENELSFPDGAKITNIEFPDDDWWQGEFNGRIGLFPANYVTLDK